MSNAKVQSSNSNFEIKVKAEVEGGRGWRWDRKRSEVINHQHW
jgi:hypothetical protein